MFFKITSSSKSVLALLLITVVTPWLPMNAERVYERQAVPSLDLSKMTLAEIDEASVQRTIYVDVNHPEANDSNTGFNEDRPKKGILSAINFAIQTISNSRSGVRIFIKDGTYPIHDHPTERMRSRELREEILIIEGESRGGVIIDGREVVPLSEVIDFGDGLFGFEWTEDWGHSTRPYFKGRNDAGTSIGNRAELLFVNGIRLDPVILEPHTGEILSSTSIKWTYLGSEAYKGKAGVTESGTFGVSEIEENMFYFRPPVGVDMSTAVIQRSVLGSFLNLREKSNLVVRNLIFIGPALFHEDAVIRNWGQVESYVENVLIEDIEILSASSGSALSISNARNFTVQRVILKDGGGNGYGGIGIDNFVALDLETSFNNWRSYKASIERWVVSGWKQLVSEDVLFDGYIGYKNQSSGLWFDSQFVNTYANEIYSVGNKTFGIYNEKNVGETVIDNSVFMGNGSYGVHFAETPNSILRNSYSVFNEGNPLGVRVKDPWRNISGLTGLDPQFSDFALIPQDNVVESSVLVSVFPEFLIYGFSSGPKKQFVDSFLATFNGDNNIYYNALFPNSTFVLPVGNGGFEDWKAAVPEGQELNSEFKDPGLKPDSDGAAFFYVYDAPGITNVSEITSVDGYNMLSPDFVNERPIASMPINWRKEAVIEGSLLLYSNESGFHEIILNSNIPSHVYIAQGMDSSNFADEPILTGGGSVAEGDYTESANNTVALVEMEAGEYYLIRILAASPEQEAVAYLNLGWRKPSESEAGLIHAPYISGYDLRERKVTHPLSTISQRNVKGSHSVANFGEFSFVDSSWIFHSLYGWLSIDSVLESSQFFAFSPRLGWVFTSTSYGASYCYSFDLGSWIFIGFLDPIESSYVYVYSGESQGWMLL